MYDVVCCTFLSIFLHVLHRDYLELGRIVYLRAAINLARSDYI